ncbi:MAG: ABC transporter ATP-binding protein/permease [Lachnospiraceae bacterium]|nr:ABC transporter ATP-binding protein/permease [Lachnospiraceae bacterium]
MLKLFGYLFQNWKAMSIVILLLLVQAFSDLSLPAYTSNIVNIGIQQGGIVDQIPKAISVDDMEKLLLFVSADNQKLVLAAYEKDTDTYLVPAFVQKESVTADQAHMDQLRDILSVPMMLITGFTSGSDMTNQMEEEIKKNIPAGQFPADATIFDILKALPDAQREEMITTIQEKIADLPETIVSQAAVAYMKLIYQDLDIDVNQIQTSYLWHTARIMLGLAFLSMTASVIVGFIGARIAAKVGLRLRGEVFRKVVGFSSNEFDRFSTASLITRSTNDIQQIQLILVMMIRMVLYAPILAIGGIYMVMQTNTSMVWIIGLAIGILSVVIVILFVVAMPKFKSLQKRVDHLNLVTREILTGLPVIRAFHTEKHEEARFEDANEKLTATNLFVNRAMTFMMPILMLIMNGVSVLIVWTGAHSIGSGQMQVGDLMAFIQYTMQIIFSFLMVCMISIMLPRASVAANRVAEVIGSQTLIHDPESPVSLQGKSKGVVAFQDVSFRYPGAETDVLHGISFVAKPGETTAFIGSTGSGKSTIVNLIPRFYDVTGGRITLDDVDIRQMTQHDLRSHLGYVPQKGILFSGDIASNIMYGNETGSREEMEEAARIAQAEEFISEKSDGYESNISQGGTNVSGGQKQRLSIARAIARHPSVYIFDDSFSALDYKTDVTLRQALKEKTGASTVLIVAQRISTILHAEQIVVLDNGAIVGIGTHQELLGDCEVYQQIASSQLSEAELSGKGAR